MRNVAVTLVALVILAALVVVLTPRGRFETTCGGECVRNVRTLAGVLELAPPSEWNGDLLPYLLERADLEGEPDLLYCPGDPRPRSEEHRTSYAFRRANDPACPVKPGVVLLADDSDDHHDGKGFVVGYAGGTVKWRDKAKDWGLDHSRSVRVGPDSVVPELRCLAAE